MKPKTIRTIPKININILPGDLCLDCTAGSGTIAVASERTQRKWIAIEQDDKYCDTIVNRLKKEVLSSLDNEIFEFERG